MGVDYKGTKHGEFLMQDLERGSDRTLCFVYGDKAEMVNYWKISAAREFSAFISTHRQRILCSIRFDTI